MPTFERLIKIVPKNTKVLDVGCGGLLGENTSQYLQNYFIDVLGVNIKENKDLIEFKKIYPNAKVIIGDYKSIDEQFGLVVLDLNIEGNLENWSDEGIDLAAKLVKKDGYLINYVMMTDQYGDPNETPALIRKHTKEYWGELTKEAVGKKLKSLKKFEFILAESEDRRNYILWVVLKKTNG